MYQSKLFFRFGVFITIVFLSGCATTQPDDPLESFNRAMYSFNDSADNVILKPIAKVYDTVTPDPISQGVSNFFNNLSEITVILNDLLQLKFGQALDDLGRFGLNSTVGVVGIFDVAGHAGYKKNDEDFGQTLGVWGFEPGAYVVLPFFGPSSIRDSFGLAGDILADPVAYIDHVPTRNAVAASRIIDSRASLLGAKNVLQEAALDEYVFVRDAYLQQRENLVSDGNDDDNFDVFSDE